MDNNNEWQETNLLDEFDELGDTDKRSRTKGKMRKRKWREIEAIKEQRRFRRELENFEQYSY